MGTQVAGPRLLARGVLESGVEEARGRKGDAATREGRRCGQVKVVHGRGDGRMGRQWGQVKVSAPADGPHSVTP